MHETRLDPLSEPPLTRFLRVIRRELGTALKPEISSERARRTVEMAELLLDHLIAREELLPSLLVPHVNCGRDALRSLAAMLDTSVAAEPTGVIGDGGAHADTLETYCVIATSLEKVLAEHMRQMEGMPEDRRRAAWAAIRTVLRWEVELHTALEQQEREGAARYASVSSADAGDLCAAQLERYLNARAGTENAIAVKGIERVLGGYSKDTFIVQLAGAARPADAIVIRRDMANGPLEGSVTSEFAVLEAAFEAGIEVPRPLWVEAGENALGKPLIVVERVPGRQLVDLKLDVVGEGIEGCVLQLARVLARIHSVDPRRAGVPEPAIRRPVKDHILELLDKFEGQWHRRRMGPSPTIAAGFAWMRNNIPDGLPGPVIVHGDPTVRNMLFDQGKVTALLDWETWHLGDPGEDLAYCRMDVERFMLWRDFLAEYHAHGGAPFEAASERYWRMWVYLRGAVTSVSMMDRLLVDPPPDIRPAFGGPHFVRMLTRKVAENLLTLEPEEPHAAQ